MPEQNTQQLINIGQEAARLLNSPVFNLAYRQTLDQLFSEFADSQPAHTKERDSIHQETHALGRVVSRLQAFIKTAEMALDQAEKEQSMQSGPDEHSGFGEMPFN